MTTKQDAIKLALEKLNEFDAKTSCLSHPEVPYHGTVNGDSEEAWQARMNQARVNILSASISEASQPVQDGDAVRRIADRMEKATGQKVKPAPWEFSPPDELA